MSLKIKLISCISLFMLMLGVLIIGVYAATQTINLKGSVEFNIGDTSLYIRDIRVQTEPTGAATTIDDFIPGHINQSIDLNLGTVQSSSGSVNVYFDFVNTTQTAYQATATGGSGVTLTTSGTIAAASETPIENVTTADISGTITLTIQSASGTTGNISLDGITITIEEYVPQMVETIALGQTDTGEILGTAESEGYAMVGSRVTLQADFTGNADAVFLCWLDVDGELVSTLADYTFTFTENSPTTYYAIFDTANNNLTYRYTVSTGIASVSGCNTSVIGDLVIPSAIYIADTFPYEFSLESISSSAFFGCGSLTSIIIPDSVTSIGNNAFYGCSSLTSIAIPSSVTSIGDSAFESCYGLETVTINEYIYTSVTSQTSCGYILYYADTVYVPQAIVENESITMGSYLASNFTQGALTDGYYVFTRN